MEVTVQIPDDIAASIAEHYKSGHLTKPELRRLLGFRTRFQLDGFLKRHNAFEEYTLEDFEAERRARKELGL